MLTTSPCGSRCGATTGRHEYSSSIPSKVERPACWRWHVGWTKRTLLPEVVLPKGAFAFCHFQTKVKVYRRFVAALQPVDADLLAATKHCPAPVANDLIEYNPDHEHPVPVMA